MNKDVYSAICDVPKMHNQSQITMLINIDGDPNRKMFLVFPRRDFSLTGVKKITFFSHKWPPCMLCPGAAACCEKCSHDQAENV